MTMPVSLAPLVSCSLIFKASYIRRVVKCGLPREKR